MKIADDGQLSRRDAFKRIAGLAGAAVAGVAAAATLTEPEHAYAIDSGPYNLVTVDEISGNVISGVLEDYVEDGDVRGEYPSLSARLDGIDEYPGAARLGAVLSTTDTTLELRTPPFELMGEKYVVILGNQTLAETEVRFVSDFTDTQIPWQAPAWKYTHAADSPVLLLDEPIFQAAWWGIKGDADTDNSIALQRALDQIEVIGGGELRFGIGIFKAEEINGVSGMRIRGMGSKTVMRQITYTDPAVNPAAAIAKPWLKIENKSNILIRDIMVDHLGAQYDMTLATGNRFGGMLSFEYASLIHIRGCSNVEINNVGFRNFPVGVILHIGRDDEGENKYWNNEIRISNVSGYEMGLSTVVASHTRVLQLINIHSRQTKITQGHHPQHTVYLSAVSGADSAAFENSACDNVVIANVSGEDMTDSGPGGNLTGSVLQLKSRNTTAINITGRNVGALVNVVKGRHVVLRNVTGENLTGIDAAVRLDSCSDCEVGGVMLHVQSWQDGVLVVGGSRVTIQAPQITCTTEYERAAGVRLVGGNAHRVIMPRVYFDDERRVGVWIEGGASHRIIQPHTERASTGVLVENGRSRLVTGNHKANAAILWIAKSQTSAAQYLSGEPPPQNPAAVRVAIANPGSSLSVSVVDNDVTVTPSSTSTAQEIINAVNADPAASALLTAFNAPGSDGSGIPAPFSLSYLQGFSAAGTGAAAHEIIYTDALLGTSGPKLSTPVPAAVRVSRLLTETTGAITALTEPLSIVPTTFTAPAIRAGSTTAGNTQAGVLGESNGGPGIRGISSEGFGAQGSSTTGRGGSFLSTSGTGARLESDSGLGGDAVSRKSTALRAIQAGGLSETDTLTTPVFRVERTTTTNDRPISSSAALIYANDAPQPGSGAREYPYMDLRKDGNSVFTINLDGRIIRGGWGVATHSITPGSIGPGLVFDSDALLLSGAADGDMVLVAAPIEVSTSLMLWARVSGAGQVKLYAWNYSAATITQQQADFKFYLLKGY